LIYCLDDGSVLRPHYDTEATLTNLFLRATSPVQTQTLPINWSGLPPKRNNRWLLYSVITLLFVAIGVGIVIWLQSREGDRQPRGLSASSTPQTSTIPTQSDVSRDNGNKGGNETENTTTPNINSGDKDDSSSGNIPTAQQLVGVWRGKVSELGETVEVTFTAYADGTYQFSTRNRRGLTSKQYGTWQYTNGTLYQTFSNGASGKGSVEWIDNDTFELTIIDNGVPAYNGLKRRYRRVG
jgi:hypothetical protein